MSHAPEWLQNEIRSEWHNQASQDSNFVGYPLRDHFNWKHLIHSDLEVHITFKFPIACHIRSDLILKGILTNCDCTALS